MNIAEIANATCVILILSGHNGCRDLLFSTCMKCQTIHKGSEKGQEANVYPFSLLVCNNFSGFHSAHAMAKRTHVLRHALIGPTRLAWMSLGGK